MDRLGDYRLRKRLAVGGMGEVYLGEKVGPEGFIKPVVLKCVLPQLAKDEAFRSLFLDEARLAALLNHPNIAQVYDFGVVDGIYYMAMEYVPGYTVDDLRRKHASIEKWMPIEHIACIATQATQGLHHAHTLTDARGVGLDLVHRDVSPHNLIVSVDGGVKIVDFGIAKARAGLMRVQAKGAVGKFGYMSPEQSRGDPVDGRTDVFSLGVCLWELTTNRRLHDAKLDRPPGYDSARPIPPASAYRRDVPRQFERILESALKIDPQERFATCQEMHLDLERFLAAMTHYAGQAALASYLRDLAEGRVEHPPDVPSREMVGPAGRRAAPRSSLSSELDGAQRYEEVFGVNVDRGASAGAPPLKAVPPTWQAKSLTPSVPPPPVATPPSVPPSTAGFELAPARSPEVGRAAAASSRGSRPAPHRPRARKSGSGKVARVLVLLCLLGGAGAAWFFRDVLVEKWLAEGPKGSKPQMTGSHRIVSTPDDAEVWIDGARKGRTPLLLELSPGIDYRIEVKKAGLGTRRLMLKASLGEGVREVALHLEPAATLKLSSEPPGASVSINGFEVAGVHTPATLEDAPAGKLRVSVALSGGPPKIREVEAPPGKVTKVHFELDAPR